MPASPQDLFELLDELGIETKTYEHEAVFTVEESADMFMGVKPEGEIREFIAKVAGPEEQENQIELLLEQAEELVSAGAVSEAGNIYSQILMADPQNLKAISSVGHLYVNERNLEGANDLLANLNEKQRATPEISSLVSAIELAEQAEQLGDYAELLASVEASPEDHQQRMELAVAMNAAGKRDEAAEHLLEIIRRKPGWNDDAARTQLLQFFEAWGLADEVTISSRRKLSSLLFS